MPVWIAGNTRPRPYRDDGTPKRGIGPVGLNFDDAPSAALVAVVEPVEWKHAPEVAKTNRKGQRVVIYPLTLDKLLKSWFQEIPIVIQNPLMNVHTGEFSRHVPLSNAFRPFSEVTHKSSDVWIFEIKSPMDAYGQGDINWWP
jgi:hypothetical protein